jgi:hypothetical protein
MRDKAQGSTDAPFWNAAANEMLRLRLALEDAHAGFDLAHDALEKGCYDEAMLHCGHHHAQTWEALLPNVEGEGTRAASCARSLSTDGLEGNGGNGNV